MKRMDYNTEIINIISDAVNKYPDMRFGQILVNLNIIQYEGNTYDDVLITKDPFNVESKKMLQNIKNSNLFKKIYIKNILQEKLKI